MYKSAKEFQDAVLDAVVTHAATYQRADGTFIQGITESCLPEYLRDRGWRKIPASGFLNSMLHEMGFEVVPALARRVYRGGVYKYAQPCKVVTL